MALAAHYSIGTATVTAGGLFVTGTGTNWLSVNVRKGDLFAAKGLSVSVDSVQNATSLTLSEPWPGAALNGARYEIRFASDSTRAMVAARAVLESIEGGSTAKHNYTAIAPPTVSDDINQGYTLGSHWLFEGQLWIATSTSPGAAVWVAFGGDALIDGGNLVMVEWYNGAKT